MGKKKIIINILKLIIGVIGIVLIVLGVGLFGGRGPGKNLALKTLSGEEIRITKGAVWPWDRTQIEEAGTYERFEYTTRTYDEEDKAVEKYANVYIPYGYDPNDTETKYDVMYLFHGYGGGASTFMGSPKKQRDLKFMVDQLIQEKKMHPMIIVNATYYSDNEEKGKNDYDREILENYREELINDLIPVIEGKYHTYEDRDHRIFAGFSMGGVMTISRMMDSMEYFRYFMDMSGPIYWSLHNTSYPDYPEDTWAGEYIAGKIKEQGYGPEDFYLYTVVGTLDFAKKPVDQMMKSIEKNTEMFHMDNKTASGNVSFWHGGSEPHTYHAKRRYLYNALPVFSSLMHGK